MIWNICLIVSVLSILLAGVYAGVISIKNKKNRIFTPFNTLFAGVFVAMLVGMIPVYAIALKDETWVGLKVFIFGFLQSIQVFTTNAGGDWITDNIEESATAIYGIYSTYMTGIFLIAPIMTFGFLVSLFKNALTDVVFKLHYFGDIYAFSELSERSLVLAQSIRENHEKALIIFTDVDREEGKILTEHLEAAEKLKAIMFQEDIVTINFMKHSNKAQISFFTIGEREGDNIIQALKLMEKYKHRRNTGLYVFSTGAEGELLIANAPKGDIKVRRVNEVRALIYDFLYDEGERIFGSAAVGESGDKEINAVIVGLGKYGTEMLKAITWYSQMDGYTVNIHAFDRDELAEDYFIALCPELMSEAYNGVHVPGESEYTIKLHSGVDVRTKTFADIIASLNKTTFVFVSLGDDEENINQAANIRMLCERAKCSPIIKAVVNSGEETAALKGIKNYRGQEYGIEAIGDFESIYSEEILIGSELEQLALQRHLKWGEEDEFWQYEYNYRSSLATAIHMKARIACGIPGASKAEDELTPEERAHLEALEHRRWNTYMRSEGYVYSGSPDKSTRNDLAKMHHDLVDFESLTEEEKRKDSKVGTK